MIVNVVRKNINNLFMPVKSPLGRVLYCYLNMPTINKTYLILSYLILSYLILSYLIVSYRIVSYRIVSYRIVKKQLINIYKTRVKYFRSGIIYAQNWRVCELLTCILAIQKQLTNRPQVITNQTEHRWTFGTFERPWNI